MGEDERLKGSDLLKRPFGIAVWDGRIYVCDHSGHDVKVFDVKRGGFYLLSGESRIIGSPTNISIDSAGYKFVVESMAKKIHVYGPDDKYVTTFLIEGARPAAVVAIGNELFVSDAVNNRILVLERSTGKLLRTFGKQGHGPGEFTLPSAMARDGEGHLYVADQMNYRLQKLDTIGKSLLVSGGVGDSYGHFARPRGIAVGPDGIIYVVESVYEVVQMFDQEGRVLMAFGNFHGAPGFLELPAGIAVDTSCLPHFRKYVHPSFEPEYLVFVVSQVGNAKVGVYAFGHLKPGAERPALHGLPHSAQRRYDCDGRSALEPPDHSRKLYALLEPDAQRDADPA